MTNINMELDDAVATGNIEKVQSLIEQGADINMRAGFRGATPLHSAAFFGRIEIARILVNWGANVNAKNDMGETPLHTAARWCANSQEHTDVVKFLIEKGADVNAKDNQGRTPLRRAIEMYDCFDPKTKSIDILRAAMHEENNQAIPVVKIGHYSLTQRAFDSNITVSGNIGREHE